MKTAIFFLVIAGILLVTGCGGAAAPTLTPAEVAQQAAAQMLDTNSLHFLIEPSGKAAYLDDSETLALKRAEGDLVRPDQVRAIAKVSTMGFSSEVAIIGLGEKQYATNPLNQQWEEIPPENRWDLDLALLFDAEHGIAAILQKTNWAFAVEGESDYILHSRMPHEQLLSLSFGLITSGEVEVELWIDRQDKTVQRIQIVELESDPDEPTTWQIQLSAFNQPVDIQAPSIP